MHDESSTLWRWARVACAVAAVSSMGAAWAQTAERPVLKPGDRWVFDVEADPGPYRSKYTWVIRSVGPDRIEGTENNGPLVLDADLNNLESPRRKDANLKLLSFPLTLGKSWAFEDAFTLLGGATGTVKMSVKVAAFEKVRVPAGEFDAFRVEAAGTYDGSAGPGQVTRVYWYAPSARAVIREDARTSHRPKTVTELAEMTLMP